MEILLYSTPLLHTNLHNTYQLNEVNNPSNPDKSLNPKEKNSLQLKAI